MVKDSYGLPGIEDTLDSLNSGVWVTALDLKVGYWQVEMDEASKPLVALTVGLHMPFGLVNVPATFQRIMETCLGELQFNCCLIYLNDIIVFSKTMKEHLTHLRAVF